MRCIALSSLPRSGLFFRLALSVLLASWVGCGEDPVEDGGLTDTGSDTGSDAVSDTPTSDGTDTTEEQPTTVQFEDGEACAGDEDCLSGVCLGEDEGFPQGMCSTVDCEQREDCSGVGRACLRGEFNGNLCVPLCGSDEDCRQGYECHGGTYCYPAYVAEALDPNCVSELIEVDGVVTGFFEPMDLHRFTFDITEGTTSFALMVYDEDQTVLPVSLLAPSGDTLDLFDDYGFFMTTGLILEHISPLMIPAGPEWTEWVQPGTYTLDVGTTGTEVCRFILENHGPGTTVDINFYFVGVRGLNVESAASDPDFQEMLEEFDATLGQAGMHVGQIRYYDVRGDVEEAFAVIRTESEVYELMALSRTPGQTREDLLSTNVFFVRDFAGEMFSVLGVAPGVPGVMGIHGQQGTGLIFSAANLGSTQGNILVGQVLAHELGHYIGLEHTTEISGQGLVDHLEDTPECPEIRSGPLEDCPDFDNLMFPIASYRDDVDITEGQQLVFQSNPLIRPEEE